MPLHPAPFFGAKRSNPKSPFSCRTASGMPKPPNSQVFGGKRAPDDHFAQFSAFGPEKRRIPARRACHRLSPLVTASSPLSLGPKSAQKAWKSEAGSAASMGLQILVDPASSHMLVSKPFLKRVSGSIPPGSAPDHPSMVHEWARLVHEWARWLRSRHVFIASCPVADFIGHCATSRTGSTG